MHEDLTWGMLLIRIDRVHVSEHFSLCLIGLDLVRGLDVFELIIVVFVGEYRVTELNKILLIFWLVNLFKLMLMMSNLFFFVLIDLVNRFY